MCSDFFLQIVYFSIDYCRKKVLMVDYFHFFPVNYVMWTPFFNRTTKKKCMCRYQFTILFQFFWIQNFQNKNYHHIFWNICTAKNSSKKASVHDDISNKEKFFFFFRIFMNFEFVHFSAWIIDNRNIFFSVYLFIVILHIIDYKKTVL